MKKINQINNQNKYLYTHNQNNIINLIYKSQFKNKQKYE